jgi:Fe-S cluster biosynthesis and repair protein YggX
MSRIVKCAKLGQELPAIAYKPFDNELGQRIYDSISQEAWRQWIEHSKRIVNEYRLDIMSPRGQKILLEEADRFFFGDGGAAPSEFKPQDEGGEKTK